MKAGAFYILAIALCILWAILFFCENKGGRIHILPCIAALILALGYVEHPKKPKQ